MKELLHPDDMNDEEYELFERGFVLDTTSEIVRHNPSILAQYIEDNDFDLIYTMDSSWYQYQDGVYVEVTEMEMNQFVFDIMNEPRHGAWRQSYASETLAAMRNMMLHTEELNFNRDLINMQNGMYDIVRNELIPHDKKYLSTIQVPIEYDEIATCPLFEKALDEWFEGDEERIRKAIEWYGYSLTTNTSAQKALFLYGLGGNGKSRYTETLSELVSPMNISSVSLVELQKNFYRATLYGKMLNIATETETGGKKFNSHYFKAITGQDTINADKKFKDVKSFKPTVKLIISMNSFPATNDTTAGFFRRIDFLPFTRQFLEEEQDENLAQRIIDTELAGVFNLAIKGLNQLRQNGYKFSACTASDQLLEVYKSELNPMIMFFAERIEAVEETHREERKVIYDAYKKWAYSNGFHEESKISSTRFWNKFLAEAKRRKITTVFGRSNKFRYQTGIKLASSIDVE